MINLVISGISGRMGKELQAAIQTPYFYKNYRLLGGFGKETSKSEVNQLMLSGNLLIDFSSSENFPNILSLIGEYKIPALICTTGIETDSLNKLQNSDHIAPILYSQNTAIQVNLFAKLAAQISKHLPDYDVDILDYHHKGKKDSPSGTALMTASAIEDARECKHKYINQKNHYLRGDHEIGFSSVRAGNIFGKHEVLIVSDDDMISLSHQSFNRSIYAKGALSIGKWLIKQAPGFYTMDNYMNDQFFKNFI